jgi:hypothetical protein
MVGGFPCLVSPLGHEAPLATQVSSLLLRAKTAISVSQWASFSLQPTDAWHTKLQDNINDATQQLYRGDLALVYGLLLSALSSWTVTDTAVPTAARPHAKHIARHVL